jgi:hypothetical protein
MLSTPPCEDDVGVACADALGGDSDGFQPRRAEAVHRRAWGALGQSRAQGGNAGDIHPRFAFGRRAAEDDIFNLAGVYSGTSGENGLDRYRGKVVRSGMAQAAARGFADRCARRCHNHGFVAHACLHKTKGYLMGFGRSYSASAYSSVATRT